MGNSAFNISPEWLILIIANLLFIIILFIMNLSNRFRLKKMIKKYNSFMSGLGSESGKNIEQLLEDSIRRANEVVSKNKEIESHINYMERNLMQCVQKVGVVRYNAFDNVGSDLSFTIALLDSSDNGLVLNGVYARDSSSTYAKPIVSGKSKYVLSAEEMQALDIAKKAHGERTYMDK